MDITNAPNQAPLDLWQLLQAALTQRPEPNWISQSCSVPARLAALIIEIEQAALQSYLARFELKDSLKLLHVHQTFKGFIQDDLTQLRRIRFPQLDGRGFLLGHSNPARANRSAGMGRKVAPLGVDLRAFPSATCFLDHHNQKWQQRGLQNGYVITLDGVEYICSGNPFPFGRLHTTIATARHTPQAWSDLPDLTHLVRSMLALAKQLPGWAILYNGSVLAGASIPLHRHLQAIMIDSAQQPFPLQQAAAARSATLGGPSVVPLVGGVDYAATCFRVKANGSAEEGRELIDLATNWRSMRDSHSENIIAVTEPEGVCLYYVPRDDFSHAAALSGAIACLELLGEVVLATEQDMRALVDGRITYSWLYEALRAIDAPEAVKLIAR